jgi:3-hydroxybutyryl-CoA dehydrogenase
MGAQIGAEYAAAGCQVSLVTRSVASGPSARYRALQGLGVLAASDLVERQDLSQIADRIVVGSSIEQGCEGSDLIVESLPELFDLKVDALTTAARSAPDAILATNTSSLSVTRLGRCCGAGERMLGTHYLNPPLLMPPVEVVPGQETQSSVLTRVVRQLARLGKEPIVVPDIPGFVWNRLQFALLREAVAIVNEGHARSGDIDMIVRLGLGRRWSAIGPFEAMAVGGLHTFTAIGERLLPELSDIRNLEMAEELAVDHAAVTKRRDEILLRALTEDRRWN